MKIRRLIDKSMSVMFLSAGLVAGAQTHGGNLGVASFTAFDAITEHINAVGESEMPTYCPDKAIKSNSLDGFKAMQRNGLDGFEAGVSELPARVVKDAPSAVEPFTLTGDFDLCFDWYDFDTYQMSSTWFTSMYESITAGDAPDDYVIKNFMREWLNPDPTDKSFAVADLNAVYDAATQSFTLKGNQFLYSMPVGDSTIDISLIGVKRLNGKLVPDKDLDIVMRWNGHGFAVDNSVLAGLLIGAETAPGSYGGLGMAYNAALYPWNSTMIYIVAPDMETEGMPYTCNAWASVNEGVLSLSNYADCGFMHSVDFALDFDNSLAVAENAALQTLQGMDGEPADLIATDIDINGNPEYEGDFLVAMMSFRNEATMMFQSRWAAMFMGEIVGVYSNTYTIIAFDIRKASAGIGEITPDDDDVDAVYFDLNGRRVDNPQKGFYIKKQGSRVSKVIM